AQGRHSPAAAGIAATALDLAPAALESAVTAAALIIAVAVAAVAAARLARPLLTDDEHAILGEVDLVDGDPTGRQQVTHGFGQGHLAERDGFRLIGLGQAEQGRGLVVVEDEATGAVDKDEALAQRVQRR